MKDLKEMVSRLCHWCGKAVVHSRSVATERHYHCGCDKTALCADKERARKAAPHRAGWYANA